jgi:hypothetical protein
MKLFAATITCLGFIAGAVLLCINGNHYVIATLSLLCAAAVRNKTENLP